jgi:hypothetical protein
MQFAEIAALGQEPSAITLEPFVVAYLEEHGPTESVELARAIEAAWLEASGAPLGGNVRPVLKRALDDLAAGGRVVQEGVFGVWRLARASEGILAGGEPDQIVPVQSDEAEGSFRRRSLSALLTQAGIVTAEQIQEALAEGERTREKLGEVVIRRGWASESQLASLLAEQWGLATVDSDADALALDPVAVTSLDPVRCAELGGFPVWLDEAGIVVVAIAEPSEERMSGFRELLGSVSFVVVARSVFQQLADGWLQGDADSPSIPTASAKLASPHQPPNPATPHSLEPQLSTIATQVRELEHALDRAQRTIEAHESELADLRETNEQQLTNIHLLEHELADRSRRLDGLREKVADLTETLEY